MKNLLKKYSNFLIQLIVITAIVIIAFQLIKVRTNRILDLDRQLISLTNDFDSVNNIRQDYRARLTVLETGYDSITTINNSLKVELDDKVTEIELIEIAHARELEKIKNIPPDTAYKFLTLNYPNNNSPLQYRFSAPQIKEIYYDVISLGQLKDRYELQRIAFTDCSALNSGYESQINNLKGQKSLLSIDLSAANYQIGVQTDKYDLINDQYRKKNNWNKVYKGIAIIEAAIIIFKK